MTTRRCVYFTCASPSRACGGVFSDGYGLGIIGISLSRAPPQLA
jgi:hypothetical protein